MDIQSSELSDLATVKKKKNKKNLRLVLSNWCRLFINANHTNPSVIYSSILLYCIQPKIFKQYWSNQHNKSSLIQLTNKNRTATINKKSFRYKKNKQINFDQLSKTHYIQTIEPIPFISDGNNVLFGNISFEIYQEFIENKFDDRNKCALNGAHKVGISSKMINPKTKKKYFIGLSSCYNPTYHRKLTRFWGNKNKKNKQENGVLFTVDIDGKKKSVLDGIAFRKFEVITMTIDWINKLVIFKRQRQNEKNINGLRKELVIKISMKSKIISLDFTKMNWFPCVKLNVNQTDSFMWNANKDDFIRITVHSGEIL